MRVEDAKWLYRWSTPVAKPSDWPRKGYGTRVEVIQVSGLYIQVRPVSQSPFEDRSTEDPVTG